MRANVQDWAAFGRVEHRAWGEASGAPLKGAAAAGWPPMPPGDPTGDCPATVSALLPSVPDGIL
jgi:hypothetical protein